MGHKIIESTEFLPEQEHKCTLTIIRDHVLFIRLLKSGKLKLNHQPVNHFSGQASVAATLTNLPTGRACRFTKKPDLAIEVN